MQVTSFRMLRSLSPTWKLVLAATQSQMKVGIYITPNLLPERYDVNFAAAGFKTQGRTSIAFKRRRGEVVDLAMQVGASTETVEVTTQAPEIQLSTSDISAVANATAVRDLRSTARSWTDLATLQPGVNCHQTQPTRRNCCLQRWATHDCCRGYKESRERCLFFRLISNTPPPVDSKAKV